MRTILALIGAVATLPLMILNIAGGVIGGIWLAIEGHWDLLLGGIGWMIAGHFLISFLLLPAMGVALLGARVNVAVVRYPLFAVAFLLNFVLVSIVSVAVFVNIVDRPHDSVWPVLLWAYCVATTPWVSLGRAESHEPGTMMWISATQFGALAIMASVFVGEGIQSPFGMALFFVLGALVGMAVSVAVRSGATV